MMTPDDLGWSPGAKISKTTMTQPEIMCYLLQKINAEAKEKFSFPNIILMKTIIFTAFKFVSRPVTQ